MNLDALRKMLDKGADSAMLRFGLGKALLDDGQYEEACEHLRRCVEFDEDYSAAWKLLGRAWEKAGNFDEARRVWQSGIEAARRSGDKQVEREIEVFLRKLAKREASD